MERRYIPLRKQRKKKTVLQPPLTPMIDVTFLLLVYFLVTAEFREAEGQIPGSLPNISGPTERKPVDVQPLRLTLVPDGPSNVGVEYQFETRQGDRTPLTLTSPQRLYQELHTRKTDSDPPLFIQVQPQVRWQHVVEAFNQATRAKYEQIGFAVAG